MMMRLNSDGRKFIQAQEGCRLEAYRDQGGVWTIGYGCTHGVSEGMKISQSQADNLFELQVQPFENGVSAFVLIALHPNEFAALVSLAYNIGLLTFKTSTLLRMLNTGNKTGAAKEFLRFCYVGKEFNIGLLNRRQREMALFMSTDEKPAAMQG